MSLQVLQRAALAVSEITGINNWYEFYLAPLTGALPESSAEIKFFRATDAEQNGNIPFILFRVSGSGESNCLVQSITVTITVVGAKDSVLASDATAQAIARAFRVPGTAVDGVIRFETSGTVSGPSYMQNGRPVFSIDVVVFTEDQ